MKENGKLAIPLPQSPQYQAEQSLIIPSSVESEVASGSDENFLAPGAVNREESKKEEGNKAEVEQEEEEDKERAHIDIRSPTVGAPSMSQQPEPGSPGLRIDVTPTKKQWSSWQKTPTSPSSSPSSPSGKASSNCGSCNIL
jgi:hypothetical protein